MAFQTCFIVVPFITGARAVLYPGRPRRCPTRAAAMALAEELALFHAGIIVLLDRHDPGAGLFLEPHLICVIGDVPRELMRQLAA